MASSFVHTIAMQAGAHTGGVRVAFPLEALVQTDYCQIVHLRSLISKLKSIFLPTSAKPPPSRPFVPNAVQCARDCVGKCQRGAQSKFIALLPSDRVLVSVVATEGKY